jgi:hypothetical protein
VFALPDAVCCELVGSRPTDPPSCKCTCQLGDACAARVSNVEARKRYALLRIGPLVVAHLLGAREAGRSAALTAISPAY